MKIKRTLIGSEYNKTYYTRSFEEIDSVPEIGDEYDGGIVVETYKYWDSEFTGEDRPRDDGYYEYYKITLKYYPGEDDEFEDEKNIAVWQEYSFDEG